MSLILPLTIKVFYEGTSKEAPYVALTPELDLSSAGPTEEKAISNLKEAVDIVLKGAIEDGTIKDLLSETGFDLKRREIKPPKVITVQFKIDLPKELVTT